MGCGTPGTAFPTVGSVRIRGISCHPLSQQADSSPAHGAGEPWVVPLRRGCGVDRWGVLRNAGDGVPYGRISYAERKLANSRESPMVLFDHWPNRTNCQPALPANFIRRAENSDRSGGFCSPNILHNPPVSNCPRRLAAKKEQTEVCSLNIYRLGDYTSSMIAISAASPRRSPMRMTRV